MAQFAWVFASALGLAYDRNFGVLAFFSLVVLGGT